MLVEENLRPPRLIRAAPHQAPGPQRRPLARRWRPFQWILLGALLAYSSVLAAQGLLQTNVFVLGPTETYARELRLVANQILLEGEVKNDAFMMATATPWQADQEAGRITLAGVCRNDAWALGHSVELSGIVEDHARFLARTIQIHGTIINNALLIGNTIHCTRSADMAAAAWIIGENLIMEGCIEGPARLVGKNVTLAGTFGQDVFIAAQDLVALPGTEIHGNLIYRAPREFIADKRIIIHGQLIRESMPEQLSGQRRPVAWKPFLYQSWLFLGALLTALLFTAFFPAFTARVQGQLRYAFWPSLATGMLILSLIPLLVLVALISIIGIPLGMLLVLTLAGLTYIGKIMTALALGLWLFRRPVPGQAKQFLWPLLMGLLLLYVGINGGWAGWALWLLVSAAGGGALLRTLAGGTPSADLPPASVGGAGDEHLPS